MRPEAADDEFPIVKVWGAERPRTFPYDKWARQLAIAAGHPNQWCLVARVCDKGRASNLIAKLKQGDSSFPQGSWNFHQRRVDKKSAKYSIFAMLEEG